MTDSDIKRQLHSLRLYPMFHGASAYKITGIATRCCMVVLTDTVYSKSKDKVKVVKQKASNDYIFLSMRNPFDAIMFFYENILPNLTEPFTLLSGGSDATIPVQTTDFLREFSEAENTAIEAIAKHPLLKTWFCENLISLEFPKCKPLLLGHILELPVLPFVTDLESKDKMCFVCHMLHDYSKSASMTREKVNQLAITDWKEFCDYFEGFAPVEYAKTMSEYKFCLCVQGGGIDPCPKLWQSIMLGTIPIVKRNSLTEALDHLLVYYVDDWTSDALNPDALNEFWKANKHKIPIAQSRLFIDYWWDNYICK